MKQMDRKKFLSICKVGGKVKFEGHEYVANGYNLRYDKEQNCIHSVELKDDKTNTLLIAKLERVEECGTGKDVDKRGA